MGKTSSGSPPRVRGKVAEQLGVVPVQGITPACAGKSLERVLDPCEVRDHPRVCGEKDMMDFEGKDKVGSPPRVRGKDLESIEIQAPFFLCAQISFNFR